MYPADDPRSEHRTTTWEQGVAGGQVGTEPSPKYVVGTASLVDGRPVNRTLWITVELLRALVGPERAELVVQGAVVVRTWGSAYWTGKLTDERLDAATPIGWTVPKAYDL